MRFKLTKNATGVYETSSLHFTVVQSVASFYINLVLNYLEKNDTHFIYTNSPSASKKDGCVGVEPVTILSILASAIAVRNANLVSMFNVVWSQIPLLTKVISTNFSSPAQAIDRVAVVVVLKNSVYSVVPLVNLH